MKTNSVGLETFIRDLTKEQISNILNNPINGVLEFREVGSDKIKGIPFELDFRKEQEN